MEEILKLENVSISYNNNTVAEDISFSLKKGEILGVVGESGSGKSTIIKAIMSILGTGANIDKGKILFKGNNILKLSEKERLGIYGSEIAMVFQDCKSSLCPVRRIENQIYDCVKAHKNISKKEAIALGEKIMRKIGLNDTKRIMKSYPFQLSGGMNQRIGICMAMLLKPDIILADEPTSALDVTTQKQVIAEMLMLKNIFGTAMIVVSHNIGVIGKMTDNIIVLKNGRVMEYGATKDVLENPQSDYTKEILSAVIRLKGNENG